MQRASADSKPVEKGYKMLDHPSAEEASWTTDVIARFEQALSTWAIQGSNNAESLHHQLSEIKSVGEKRIYILTQVLPSLMNEQGEDALLPDTVALKGLVQTWLHDNGLSTENIPLRTM